MSSHKIAKIAFYSCAVLSLVLVFCAVGDTPDQRSATMGWIGWGLAIASLLMAPIARPWK